LQTLHVHFLPTLIEASNLAGSVAVIIDILRASSTIVTALHHGANCVIPCGTPEAARKIRAESNGRDVLLGGERGGVLIDGFDCGNSPSEYSSARVAEKTIAFTTTNGTRALLKAAAAETILIGAFMNRKALLNRLQSDQRPIHLICAGTDGSITGEDVLFAGVVVDDLVRNDEAGAAISQRWKLNDCAWISRAFWQQAVGSDSRTGCGKSQSARIETAMRETHGGLNLRELGYDKDIGLCSAVDAVDLVPQLNRENGELT
jgi:2-phosphosulfolactate phosphatase